jgi:hypothetical protein
MMASFMAMGQAVKSQYSISGDMAVKPDEVFNDGKKTYIKMPSAQLVPTILVGGQMAAFSKEPPFLVLESEPDRIDFVRDGSYATAIKRMRVVELAPTPPDQSTASATVTTPTGMSIAPVAITTAPLAAASSTTISAIQFSVFPRDQTISSALFRWCATAKCQLVWSAEKDLPAMQATYSSDFETALGQLMTDTRHSDYPLHACMYENGVVLVKHVTQSCGK